MVSIADERSTKTAWLLRFSCYKNEVVTYDDTKRQLNLDAHGFDFTDFATQFDGSTAVFVETRPSRTGRERFRVIGLWSDGSIVTAILSPLGSEAWSLVSLRTASHKERRVYAEHNPTD